MDYSTIATPILREMALRELRELDKLKVPLAVHRGKRAEFEERHRGALEAMNAELLSRERKRR